MGEFQKDIFITNIYGLVEQKGLKIGELEKDSGLSVGFLSRLKKEDSTSKLPVDSAAKLAEILGVSLDTLISYDVINMSIAERYQAKFLFKLLAETEGDALKWQAIRLADIKEMLSCFDYEEEYYEGPPFMPMLRTDIVSDGERIYPGIDMGLKYDAVAINNDFYYADIASNARIYVGDVKYASDDKWENAVDFWACGTGSEVEPLFSSKDATEIVKAKSKKLIPAIKRSFNRSHLTKRAMTFIDCYLQK